MAGFDPSLQPTDSRAHLLTEQSNDRSSRLDQLDTAALVQLFVEEDRRPQQAVSAAADALARPDGDSARVVFPSIFIASIIVFFTQHFSLRNQLYMHVIYCFSFGITFTRYYNV